MSGGTLSRWCMPQAAPWPLDQRQRLEGLHALIFCVVSNPEDLAGITFSYLKRVEATSRTDARFGSNRWLAASQKGLSTPVRSPC